MKITKDVAKETPRERLFIQYSTESTTRDQERLVKEDSTHSKFPDLAVKQKLLDTVFQKLLPKTTSTGH